MNNVKQLLNRLELQSTEEQKNPGKEKKPIRLYLLIFILVILVIIYVFIFYNKPNSIKSIQENPNPPILQSNISIKKMVGKSIDITIVKKSINLIKTQKIKEAIFLLEKNKPANISDNPNYFSLLASLYLSQKNLDSAHQLYQTLLQYDNTQAIWWLGLGITLKNKGDLLLAENAFSQAQKCQNLSPVWKSFVKDQLKKM